MTWTQRAKLVAEDGAALDNFGQAIALSGNVAVIGAYAADGPPPYGNPSEGAAYVVNGVDEVGRLFGNGFESPANPFLAPMESHFERR
jgi:hypothetical protein